MLRNIDDLSTIDDEPVTLKIPRKYIINYTRNI